MQNKVWMAGATALIIAAASFVLIVLPTTAGPSSGTTVTNSGTGSSTVTLDDIPTLDMPDFNSPINFGPGIEADLRAALERGAATLSMRLSENPTDLGAWINLGTVRKMGGDFKGAEAAWIFVTKSAPGDTIAYNNLGDLYMYSMKDYQKTEQAYLTAIKLSPAEPGPYQALSQLYTNFYKKGTGAAEDILKKGVAANPNSIDMHVVLARYYRAAGHPADAKTQYEAAIAIATKTGQTEAASQLRAEENQ